MDLRIHHYTKAKFRKHNTCCRFTKIKFRDKETDDYHYDNHHNCWEYDYYYDGNTHDDARL